MFRRVPGRQNNPGVFHCLFAVFDETRRSLLGSRFLRGGIDKKFHYPARRGFRFISPEIVLDLRHNYLRIGEKRLSSSLMIPERWSI